MSDVMLLGVLRMPMPDNPDPLTLRQFVDRARQAADRIEADATEIEHLRAEVESWRQQASDRVDDALQFAKERDALRSEVEHLLTALRLAEGALLQCQPCLDPECQMEQKEWLDAARTAVAAAIRGRNG